LAGALAKASASRNTVSPFFLALATASSAAAAISGSKRAISDSSSSGANRKLPLFHNSPSAMYCIAFWALGFSTKAATFITGPIFSAPGRMYP
jgi:hypothetical protein